MFRVRPARAHCIQNQYVFLVVIVLKCWMSDSCYPRMPSTEVSHANDTIGTAARIPFHPILNRARLLERKAGNNNRAGTMSFGFKSTSSEDSAICGWQDKCTVKAQARSLWMSQAKVNSSLYIGLKVQTFTSITIIESRIQLWVRVNVISHSLDEMSWMIKNGFWRSVHRRPTLNTEQKM